MSKAGIAAYGEACKENELSEERRLGYVAATRARDLLIASAHWWGPTQIKRRGPSEMFEAVVACCEAGGGEVISMAPEPPEGVENPALDEANVARVVWPIEPEPAAEERRQWAAAAVRERMGGDGSAAGSDLTHELSGEEQELVAGWDRDLDLLVAELRRTAARATRDVALPTSLSATQMLALRERPDELARDIARPMPSPPRPAARRGSRFHAWLEGRSGERPLLGPLDVPGAGDAEITDDADLIELQEAFEAGPWADRVPVAQEVAFALVLGGRVIRGRIDAVFAAPPGGEAAYEVVDWKTNRRHDADPLQLAIYRVAWAELAGVPEEAVIAAFAYIRDGAVVTPADLPGRAELERILRPE
jgi:DNA helicase-2/ATP-dependent DNA helicase PcrA